MFFTSEKFVMKDVYSNINSVTILQVTNPHYNESCYAITIFSNKSFHFKQIVSKGLRGCVMPKSEARKKVVKDLRNCDPEAFISYSVIVKKSSYSVIVKKCKVLK